MAPKKRTTKKAAATAAPAAEAQDAQPAAPAPESAAEHVLVKLPISDARIDELLRNEDMQTILEYNPKMSEPMPYDPVNNYGLLDAKSGEPEAVNEGFVGGHTSCAGVGDHAHDHDHDQLKPKGTCFWCVHPIEHEMFGMPTRYDVISKTFTVYGVFCSLECAAAHNFATHADRDRAWEIHSWIQMLGTRFGYTSPVRPAPSRYVLNTFGGPLTIEEFRKAHRDTMRSYVLNIPPMINVTSQTEAINTSFIGRKVTI